MSVETDSTTTTFGISSAASPDAPSAGPITGSVKLPSTFRDASRPVTTFQRAVLESAGERVDLAHDAVSRFVPGPPAVVEAPRRRRRVSPSRRLR